MRKILGGYVTKNGVMFRLHNTVDCVEMKQFITHDLGRVSDLKFNVIEVGARAGIYSRSLSIKYPNSTIHSIGFDSDSDWDLMQINTEGFDNIKKYRSQSINSLENKLLKLLNKINVNYIVIRSNCDVIKLLEVMDLSKVDSLVILGKDRSLLKGLQLKFNYTTWHSKGYRILHNKSSSYSSL